MTNNENAAMKRLILDRIKNSAQSRINGMLDIDVIECSHEDCSVVISFGVKDWMLNPSGILHGGVLSTFFDVSMGVLAIYINGGVISPTANLSVSFIRPVQSGDSVVISACCRHSGRTMTQATASAYSRLQGAECAFATAIFSKSTVAVGERTEQPD